MSNKPNFIFLHVLQKYSTRGWVYRTEQGWLFAELTPEELAEFRSYEPGITITRMRIRPPCGSLIYIYREDIDCYANCFVHCTMPQVHPLALSRFQIHQVTGSQPKDSTRNPVEPGSYEAWLWADEVKFCRELGCEITVRSGWCWDEWIPPSPYKKRVFIYAFVNELTQEVYVGQTEDVERRWTEHLRDTKNSDKVALIQSLRALGREPKPIKLEEVTGEKAFEQERYWTSFYKNKGYKVINRDYISLSGVDKE